VVALLVDALYDKWVALGALHSVNGGCVRLRCVAIGWGMRCVLSNKGGTLTPPTLPP